MVNPYLYCWAEFLSSSHRDTGAWGGGHLLVAPLCKQDLGPQSQGVEECPNTLALWCAPGQGDVQGNTQAAAIFMLFDLGQQWLDQSSAVHVSI